LASGYLGEGYLGKKIEGTITNIPENHIVIEAHQEEPQVSSPRLGIALHWTVLHYK